MRKSQISGLPLHGKARTPGSRGFFKFGGKTIRPRMNEVPLHLREHGITAYQAGRIDYSKRQVWGADGMHGAFTGAIDVMGGRVPVNHFIRKTPMRMRHK